MWNSPKVYGQDKDFIYLIKFARKHDLTTSNLHDSLLVTRQHGNAQCGPLLIERRSRGKESSMYMFSLKGKVLAQANIQDASIRKLVRPPEGFSGLPEADKGHGSKRLDANTAIAIENLRFGLSGVSFKARVVRKAEVRAVTSRDGNPYLVCDITLSDGTGEIPMGVWDSQIGTVSLGDTIQIHNASVRSFRGQLQLSLGRKTGLLTVLEHST
jgi:hypothetical protein